MIIEEGVEVDASAARSPAPWRRPRRRPASPSSPATPRSSTAAPATSCSSIRPGSASFVAGVDLGAHRAEAGRCDPRQRASRRSWRGDSRGAWRSSARVRRSKAIARRCTRSSIRLLAACPQVKFMRDATRGGARHRAQRNRRSLRRRHRDRRSARRRCATRSRASAKSSASIRSISPTKARSSRSCRHAWPRRRARPWRRIRSGRDAAIIGHVDARPPPAAS